MQAPGGPEEDLTGGFAFGGWIFHYCDEVMGRSMNGFDGKDRDLVLGRRTYETFEAHWPYQPPDDPIAQTLNAAKKHGASRTLKKVHWNNSTLLRRRHRGCRGPQVRGGPGPADYRQRQPTPNAAGPSLIDEYNVWTSPVLLGRGKRLFEAGATPGALRLVASQASTTGVVMSTYLPTGDVPTRFHIGNAVHALTMHKVGRRRERRCSTS